ncbi:hypothetical protein M0R04_14765 [Candidatus Dojkabacteria bacterium]|jgi:hypothetical protein|nr:hypothetical protein [Candidatus Dojkabacteria bacterium]
MKSLTNKKVRYYLLILFFAIIVALYGSVMVLIFGEQVRLPIVVTLIFCAAIMTISTYVFNKSEEKK